MLSPISIPVISTALDPAAVQHRRAKFYNLAPCCGQIFYGLAKSQPNLSNLLASRIVSAQIGREHESLKQNTHRP